MTKLHELFSGLGGVKILDTHTSLRPGREREYAIIDTSLGRYVIYTMQADDHATVSYKNVSIGDIFWRMMDASRFANIFSQPPLETFASKRLSFPRERVSVEGSGVVYQLSEPRKKDGFLYEIPASELKAFPGTRYPDMVFAYTHFNLEAMRLLSPSEIERLKIAEAVRFNGPGSRPCDLDLTGIANISETVYRYAVGGKAAL